MFAALFCWSSPFASAESNPWATLRKAHPRLLFSREDQRRVEELAKNDPLLADVISLLKRDAEWVRQQPAQPTGKSMMAVARDCEVRICTSALAFRLTGNQAFAQRARQDLLTVAALKDWNPRHFLDTGEMTAAVAIGYDWVYDALSETDRATIREAIVSKALEPALKVYPHSEWAGNPNNWNQVCNGGVILGALAVADEKPEVAARALSGAVASLPQAMASYDPDGAWFESPVYWHYGGMYNVLALAALDSALGHDFGLSKSKGFDQTGFFRMQTIGPTGDYFNFGDGSTQVALAPCMFWLAQKFDRPIYTWSHKAMLKRYVERLKKETEYSNSPAKRFLFLEAVWYDSRDPKPTAADLPLDAHFSGLVELATFRSSWDDPNGLYVAMKGGSNGLGHSHLDNGTFVLDADGERWAMDLGNDSYHNEGYFDGHGANGKRWSYLRTNSKGHNTLVIGGKLQNVESRSKATGFSSTPGRAFCTLDMSDVYRGQAGKVMRGIAVLDRSRVLVQDEIARATGGIRWGMITPAKIELKGGEAVLSRNGKVLNAKILEPANATFQIVSTQPENNLGNKNQGTSMLAISVEPAAGNDLRLRVLLTPVGAAWPARPAPEPVPLSQW